MQNFHVTYLPADWGFSPPSPNKYGWLSNRTSQLVSLHQVDLLVSSHHTLPELLIPSPHRLNKTLVGQSECSHCEALDTLQLLVKLTHVWSLRSKCQHIERRNYVTPQKKGWIVGKKNVSFFLAGLIICLPQNTSGEGKKLKKLRTNIHTCFSFVILLGPPFWHGDRQVGKVVCRSYRIPMGFSGGFFGTLHLIAKQKFNHPCRWEIYPSILGNLFIINPLPEFVSAHFLVGFPYRSPNLFGVTISAGKGAENGLEKYMDSMDGIGIHLTGVCRLGFFKGQDDMGCFFCREHFAKKNLPS